MSEITVDELLKKTKNRFLLSNAVAGRSKQIAEGSLPYIDDFNPANPIITAIREIAKERIKIKIGTARKKKEVAAEVEEKKVKRISLKKEKKTKKSKKKKK